MHTTTVSPLWSALITLDCSKDYLAFVRGIAESNVTSSYAANPIACGGASREHSLDEIFIHALPPEQKDRRTRGKYTKHEQPGLERVLSRKSGPSQLQS